MTPKKALYLREIGFPGGTVVKNLPVNAEDSDWIPGLGRSPGEGNGKPTPVFLLGKSYGQRSLVGYSPRNCKESDTTQHTHTECFQVSRA